MEGQIIMDWYNALTSYMSDCISNGRKVVVIALSRKMPRLLSWIMDSQLSVEQRRTLESLLKSDFCIYTTEHGIPFVFNDSTLSEANVLILDDIIISGETIGSISDEVEYFIGKKPDYLSFYAYQDVQANSISECLPVTVDGQKPARKLASEFSNIIADHCLPVDMEFPILHWNMGTFTGDYSGFVEIIKDKYDSARFYELGRPGNRNFTLLVDSDAARQYNNDFAKVRIFEQTDGVKVVCYAPNVFSEVRLNSSDLFENSEYRAIWTSFLDNEIISDPVSRTTDIIIDDDDRRRHLVSQRRMHSLVVLANYLLSLSLLIREKSNLGLLDYPAVELRVDDLALITGSKLAPALTKIFNSIYERNITSTAKRMRVKLPSSIAPVGFSGLYRYLTTIILYESDSASEALTGIFARGLNLKEKHSDLTLFELNRVNSTFFLESYESLCERPRKMMRSPEGKLEINRTIDDMIDNGLIVPLYYFVEKEPGNFYWRRFFRASHPLLVQYTEKHED